MNYYQALWRFNSYFQNILLQSPQQPLEQKLDSLLVKQYRQNDFFLSYKGNPYVCIQSIAVYSLIMVCERVGFVYYLAFYTGSGLLARLKLFFLYFYYYFFMWTTIFNACPFRMPIYYNYDCLISLLWDWYTQEFRRNRYRFRQGYGCIIRDLVWSQKLIEFDRFFRPYRRLLTFSFRKFSILDRRVFVTNLGWKYDLCSMLVQYWGFRQFGLSRWSLLEHVLEFLVFSSQHWK